MAAQHRAKNFFGPQAAVQRHVGVQGRADEPAGVAPGFASGHALQPFGAGDGKVLAHLGPLRLTGQRPHVDFAGQRVAHAQGFKSALQKLGQRIGNALVHQQARGGRAHLPAVPGDTGHDPFHGLIKIAILKHHNRRLAAQLQGDRAAMGGGAVHHLRAHRVAAGERQLVQPRVIAQRNAGLGFSANDVQHAGRQAQGIGNFAVGLLDQRGNLRRLEHHRATRREGRGELPGAGHQREIPRHDQADNPHRLQPCVGGKAGH